MRIFLWLVVAFVLGAVLVYYFAPARPGPQPPPHTKETHEAAVVVQTAGNSDNCKVKTYSPVMTGRPTDDFTWTIVAVGACADYANDDLQIATKNPNEAPDLEIRDTSPGPSRLGTVPRYPNRCLHQPPPCKIQYKVTVKSTDPNRPDLTEDPRIEIWP